MSKLFVNVKISKDDINNDFLPNENVTDSEWNDLRFHSGEDWNESVTAFVVRDMKRRLDEIRKNNKDTQVELFGLDNPWLDLEIKEQKIQRMIEDIDG